MALNRARIAKDAGINNDLSYQVAVEYFDVAAPGTVLWSETFTVPANATLTQLQNRVIARGQDVRTGLTGLASLQASLPIGSTLTVP